jgi:LemA protein
MSNRKWLIPVIIIGVILLLIVFPLVSAYNDLVGREASVDQSFADLDAQYQRRADLIPNLSAAVKAALRQEQKVFGDIADARTRYTGANTPAEKNAAAGQMESALARLLVIVEQYPDLKSNENIRDLMTQVEGTENRVAQSRRDYNQTVTAYNVNVRRFPRNLIAGLFGFDPKPLFEAEPEDREAPDVELELDETPAATG